MTSITVVRDPNQIKTTTIVCIEIGKDTILTQRKAVFTASRC